MILPISRTARQLSTYDKTPRQRSSKMSPTHVLNQKRHLCPDCPPLAPLSPTFLASDSTFTPPLATISYSHGRRSPGRRVALGGARNKREEPEEP